MKTFNFGNCYNGKIFSTVKAESFRDALIQKYGEGVNWMGDNASSGTRKIGQVMKKHGDSYTSVTGKIFVDED